MIAFICLFFPAAISVIMYEKITKESLTRKQTVEMYIIHATAINALCFAVKTFLLGTGMNPLCYGKDMTPSAAIRYLIMAIPFSLAITVVHIFCKRNVKVELTDNEEN